MAEINLVPVGKKLSNGRTVNPKLLLDMHSKASEEDKKEFYPLTQKTYDSQTKSGAEYFAVENDMGELVGTVAADFKTKWKGWIGRAFFMSEHRNKGYASATYSKIGNLAAGRGVKKVFMFTPRKNYFSRKAAKRAGFKHSWAITAKSNFGELRDAIRSPKLLLGLPKKFITNPYFGYAKKISPKRK